MPKHPFRAAGEAMPSPRPTIFLAITPTMRLRLATTIENLIALLDAIDGDADLEDGHDAEREDAECDLADVGSDLEHDAAEYDCPAFIWGGSVDEVEMRP